MFGKIPNIRLKYRIFGSFTEYLPIVFDQVLVTEQLKGISTLSEKEKIAEYSVYLPNIRWGQNILYFPE